MIVRTIVVAALVVLAATGCRATAKRSPSPTGPGGNAQTSGPGSGVGAP
jgi:hypothetical protein